MTTAVDKLVQGYCSYRDGSYEDSRPLIEDLVELDDQPTEVDSIRTGRLRRVPDRVTARRERDVVAGL